ncbi:hypothetical protein [uncultured Jatrophihabitans sp.]|uniref:hypothetical protein n=1 Tax=uncultured Jatrophihabitans sp. TaxID=1610747 RepID=UPI0035CB9CE4
MADEHSDDIPHERRSKYSNIVAGKAKEVIGRLTHDDEYIAEGRTQEEVAEDDVEPDLDDDAPATDSGAPPH